MNSHLVAIFPLPAISTDVVDGAETFDGHFDVRFGLKGIVFSGAAVETPIWVNEFLKDGRLCNLLPKTAGELEKMRLLGSQFLAICRFYRKKMRQGGYSNFFILTKGDERVAEDFGNVFVAKAFVRDNKLLAFCEDFNEAHISRREDRDYFFTPPYTELEERVRGTPTDLLECSIEEANKRLAGEEFDDPAAIGGCAGLIRLRAAWRKVLAKRSSGSYSGLAIVHGL